VLEQFDASVIHERVSAIDLGKSDLGYQKRLFTVKIPKPFKDKEFVLTFYPIDEADGSFTLLATSEEIPPLGQS
jgi:hypothetical protein